MVSLLSDLRWFWRVCSSSRHFSQDMDLKVTQSTVIRTRPVSCCMTWHDLKKKNSSLFTIIKQFLSLSPTKVYAVKAFHTTTKCRSLKMGHKRVYEKNQSMFLLPECWKIIYMFKCLENPPRILLFFLFARRSWAALPGVLESSLSYFFSTGYI